MSATKRLFTASSIAAFVLCPMLALAGTAWTDCSSSANLVGHSFDNGYVMGANQYLYSCGSYASDLPPISSPRIMRLSPVFVRLHQRCS